MTMLTTYRKILWCLCLQAVSLYPVFAQSGDFSSNREVSYAIGVLLARSIQDSGVIVNFESFADGLKKTLNGNPGITQEAAAELVQNAMQLAMSKQKEDNLKKSSQFLEKNKKKKGIHTTASGLQYEVIEAGKGSKPKKSSVVIVHYVGSLIDGTIFDSSRERDEPATIPLEQVIPGWSEGLQLMRVGEKARFFIPPALGYGEESMIAEIPPNSVLIFEVELLEIEGE